MKRKPEFSLLDFEKEVLKCVAGRENNIEGWGAAVSVALEFLQSHGLVTKGTSPVLTTKGEDYLDRN